MMYNIYVTGNTNNNHDDDLNRRTIITTIIGYSRGRL